MDESVKQCMEMVVAAFDDFNKAKQECDDLVGAALDQAASVGVPDQEIKNIKRAAKAIADGKMGKLAAEVANFSDFLVQYGYSPEEA